MCRAYAQGGRGHLGSSYCVTKSRFCSTSSQDIVVGATAQGGPHALALLLTGVSTRTDEINHHLCLPQDNRPFLRPF